MLKSVYFKCLFILLALTFFRSQAQTEVLLKGHAHNDYKHGRPLLDAVENGMFSVEADIYYAGGNFIVAHLEAGVKAKNTLEKLYLQPLEKLAGQHNGKIYEKGPKEFVLMIDLKGKWHTAQLKELEKIASQYRDMLTIFENGVKKPGAVRIVLSGSASGLIKEVAQSEPRYFSIDGGLSDYNSAYNANVIPRISASYGSIFNWRGRGKMPEDQKQLLKEWVTKAHQYNRKIRFWAATNKTKVWKELLDAGVNWINVDKLQKFRKFYLSYQR